MRKFIQRAIASVLLAALVLTSAPGGVALAEETAHVHVHEEESPLYVSEEELAGGEVLLVTADMLDEKGVVNVAGGSWDRIVVTRTVGAKKIVFTGITAKTLVMESGSQCSYEVSNSVITDVNVVAANLEVMDYETLVEMLASGVSASEVADAYTAYQKEKKELEEILPSIVLKAGTEITSLTVSGNAELNLAAAKVAEVKVTSDGTQDRTEVVLEGYNGTVSIDQKDAGTGANSILNLDLKDSTLAALNIAGTEKSVCYIEGLGESNVTTATITGSTQVTMNVEADEVKIDAKAEKASVSLYSDVKNVVVEGDNNQVRVAASAEVENAVIEGDNVKVSNSGIVNQSTVSGAGSGITYVPVNTPRPTATPKPTPTTVPEPTAAPEPTTAPEQPDTPTPPAEDVHVHTWNVPAATCSTAKQCTDPECGFVEEAATGLHDFATAGVVTEATCVTGGYTIFTCKYCDEQKQGDFTAPKGHSVAEWTIGAKAENETCWYTQTGICTVCNETQTSETKVEKHNAELVVYIATAATCQTDGTKEYQCPDCGKVIRTEKYTNKDAHSWDGGTEENGKTVYKCTVDGCSATKSVVIMTEEGVSSKELDANTQVETGSGVVMSLDNSVLQQINSGSTSASSGAAIKLSADVLDTTKREETVSKLKEEEKAQLGNNDIYDLNMLVNGRQESQFSGEVTVRIPYVLQDGDDPEAIGIWYLTDKGQVEMIKGKFHEGFVTFATKHFSYYTVVRLSAEARCKLFGHLWLSTTTNPTCTEDGYVTSICQRCGETTITPGEKATGHNIVETVIEEATCQHKGKHRRECNNKHCPYYTEVETPKAEHKLKEKKDGRHEATCTQDGYIEYECKDKGCTYYKNEVIPALGHESGKDGRCKRCGLDMSCTHNNAFMMVKLAEGATTCEEGVASWLYCPDCGSTLEEFEVVKEHTYGVVDYVGFGESSDGAVVLMGCACGEGECWVERKHSHNNWYSEGSSWDDNGTKVTNFVETCQTCGVYTAEICYNTPLEGCQVIRHSEIYVTVGDEMVGSTKWDYKTSEHYTVQKVALAEGSKTCLDGVERTRYCLKCNADFGTYTSKSHANGLVDYIDLSKYGDCGGFITFQRCACGENGMVNSWNIGCDLQWVDGHGETVNGVQTYSDEYVCRKCGLTATNTQKRTPLGDCRAQFEGSWSILVDGNAVETMEYSYESDYHNTRETATLLEGSTSCLDGVQMTMVCVDCGKVVGEWTEYDHANAVKEEVDFSKYETTCGGELVLRGCACGENQWVDYPSGHDLVWNYEDRVDDNGMESQIEIMTCRNCSIKVERKRTAAKNDNCSAVASYEYKIYVDEALVDTWAYTVLESAHEIYYAEVTLKEAGTTCENGTIVKEKCWNCDWENTWENNGNWHPAALVENADLAALGVACGGTIRHYICPCGDSDYSEVNLKCDTGYSWNDMNDNLEFVGDVDGTRIHRREFQCAVTDPKCTFKMCIERHMIGYTDNCTGETKRYFCGDADGDGVYEIRIEIGGGSWSSHKELGETVTTYDTAEDGTALKIETRSCEACGDYKNINVYADYLGDESYRYHIRSEWGDSNGMDYEDWIYDFGSDSCSYTRVRSDSNGWYSEQETRPGCVTDNVTSWRTCTDYSYGVCLMCGKENALNARMYGEPMGHDFVEKPSGNGYECSRCGLESENGSSGKIVLEDVSDDNNFIASYWNEQELVYEIFVFLVTANEDIMTDLKPVDNGFYQSGTATLSQASVEAWAAANGVSGSYNVMFGFIPKNASVDSSYYLTFAEKHNWAYKTALLQGSTSCSDGILVTEYCLDCGETGDSWESTEHVRSVQSVLDISLAEGSCGGRVIISNCACGENNHLNTWEYTDCDFEHQGGSSYTEDGVSFATETWICSKCGNKLFSKCIREKLEGVCKATYTGTIKLYAADDMENAVAEAERSWTGEYHEGRDSFELVDGKSCEGGVNVTYACVDCGLVMDEYVMYEHNTREVARIDLSQYIEGCNKYFAWYECACKKSYGRHFPGGRSIERILDETEGATRHYIEKHTYEGQEYWHTEEVTSKKNDNCTADEIRVYTVYVGETAVGTYTYDGTCEMHDTYCSSAELVTPGTNCNEGITRTIKCRDCDYGWTDTVDWHETIEVARVDLDEYIEGCNEYFAWYECACGEMNGFHCPDGYSKESERVEVDGVYHNIITYTYADQPYWYTKDEAGTKNQDCTETVARVYTVYVNDTVVGTYSDTLVREAHEGRDFVELLDGAESCEDGIYVTYVCTDCGYVMSEYTAYKHIDVYMGSVDTSSEGTCGEVFSFYECACGQEAHLHFPENWNSERTDESVTDDNGVAHRSEIYSCTACEANVRNVFTITPTDNCKAVVKGDYGIFVGDTQIGNYSYEKLWDNHNVYISETALLDGSVTCVDGITLTRKCYNCDWSSTEVVYDHRQAETEVYDTSLYENTCGGRYVMYACACGDSLWLSRPGECDLVEEGEWTRYTDDSGYEHDVITRACTRCSVSDVQDHWEVSNEDGTWTIYYNYKMYVGEQLIGETNSVHIETK